MDAMIDIETLSTSSNRAVILSIAAVRFVVDRDDGPYIDQGHFFAPLDIREQLVLWSLRVDDLTLTWWQCQSEAAREAAVGRVPVGIHDALTKLEEWLQQQPVERVWANGIVFDIGNLEARLERIGRKPPWKYNRVLDARTVYQVCPERRQVPPEELEKLVGHSPVDDCVKQIWRLWAHWPTP